MRDSFGTILNNLRRFGMIVMAYFDFSISSCFIANLLEISYYIVHVSNFQFFMHNTPCIICAMAWSKNYVYHWKWFLGLYIA